MTQPLPLGQVLRPRHVAIVGASSKGGGPGFVGGMKAMGFEGPVYPVNPKAEEIGGYKCYPSLLDCPTDVDYVISSVPAPVVPTLIDQAIQKNTRLIHLFTAGFSETGDPERTELERRSIQRAVDHGIRVLGPNCMGLYIPRARVSFMADVPAEPGNVTMISQSGANASEFTHRAMVRGIRFASVFSYGNGADLRDAELLEYAAEDPDTEIITMYTEGVRDGRRFFEALKKAAAAKPVIVLKGGRTDAGGRAARSHTGSLAGSIQVFDAACRQAGAIRVESLDELVDLTVAFRFVPRPLGNRFVMVLSGGGTSVLAADDLASAGLDTPPLTDEVREELAKYIPIAGTSIRNPVDINMFTDNEALPQILDAVGQAPNADAVYFHVSFNWNLPGNPEERAEQLIDRIREAQSRVAKPFVLVVEPGRELHQVEQEHAFVKLAWEHAFPVFPTPLRAAEAYAHVLRWYRERPG